ncbi:tRNA uridine-5-carboxymethylaminomethyl(34) synthesis GTPase MnmE [Gammaproteobacteria bacterium 53_120_T64]|nr:tRNA uridine-5-carboxymethylaminomethyl(34) synthesis GTPase MnmE [Gammaproteobacteria bacterium 53_120_T64]
MLVNNSDVIAALITPPGRGGVGIIRLSGDNLDRFFDGFLGFKPTPRYAHFQPFLTADGDQIDEGIVLYFASPNSYTGEHILELQGHGGPVVMDILLRRALELGARQARPGEFSERAFLNGKMDLTQVEAVADLIDAGSEQAARGAIKTLQGQFSRQVSQLLEHLIQLRVYVEAAIDFPEEEVDFLSDGKIEQGLLNLGLELKALLANVSQGALLREGISVVIAGKPNAGKSSLLNALSGHDLAIVTDVPGTTRDVLRQQINIDGMPLHIIDTAGLRATDDTVERHGIERAQDEIKRADQILLLIDASEQYDLSVDSLCQHAGADFSQANNVTFVLNKTDRPGYVAVHAGHGQHPVIEISAKTGAGLPDLKQHLKNCAGYVSAGEGLFSARRRHISALQKTEVCIAQALEQLLTVEAGELIAEDLKQAQHALGAITGDYTSDDLLGEIFSSFCIGK